MMQACREAGIEVAYDWTVVEGDICACGCERDCHKAGKGACIWGEKGGGCGCELFRGVGVGGDHDLPGVVRLQHAIAESAAIRYAEIFWLLAAHDHGSVGAWVELGMALARASDNKLATDGTAGQPHVIVSGPKHERTIFTDLASAKFHSDQEALAFILRRHAASAQPRVVQVFSCPGGCPPGECDTKGPGVETEHSSSVSCSKCGQAAIDRAMWEGP